MLYATVRVKHLLSLVSFHSESFTNLATHRFQLAARTAKVQCERAQLCLRQGWCLRNAKQRNLGVRPVLSCVYVMSRLQLVTVGCVFNFATELCRKAIDGRGLFGVGARAQIGKLTAQVVKWAVLYCSLARLPGTG